MPQLQLPAVPPPRPPLTAPACGAAAPGPTELPLLPALMTSAPSRLTRAPAAADHTACVVGRAQHRKQHKSAGGSNTTRHTGDGAQVLQSCMGAFVLTAAPCVGTDGVGALPKGQSLQGVTHHSPLHVGSVSSSARLELLQVCSSSVARLPGRNNLPGQGLFDPGCWCVGVCGKPVDLSG